MYYQCCVLETDQDFLRFLWFKDNLLSGDAIHCRMTRLAYGLLCSQSGAQFCLRRAILNNETAAAPETLELALRSFYVDDLLTSVSASSELLKFYEEITALLESGGFPLCKFGINCEMLLSQIPRKDLAPSFVSFKFDKDCNVAHKSLGMKWVPNGDVIVFSIDLEVREFTRRGILCTYSQILIPPESFSHF